VRRGAGIVLSVVLLVGVVVAVLVGGGLGGDDDGKAGAPADLATVRGVIGSEKKPFFDNPQVRDAFARHGLRVEVDTAGSRQIGTTVDLKPYDFAFPSSAPSAEQVRGRAKVAKSYSPFSTPMAIASFQPIVDVLARAGVARKAPAGYWLFDVEAYLKLVGKDTRWDQIAGTAYTARKSVLLTSTDVRKSNSGAMYLAIASYVANGNRVVDRQQVRSVLPVVSRLFLDQGYSEASTEAPFEDYLALGAGKTPMVMIYESQWVDRFVRKDGSITSDMVLMYPTPTVLSKHTLVPLTADGDRVGQLLTNDPELRGLAARFGYRTADRAAFVKVVKAAKAPVAPNLVDVVEPPSFEVLEQLITEIEKQY
jgi:hypothetical protein